MKISVIATGGTIGSQTGSEGIRALRHDLDAIGRVLKNRPNGYPQDDLTVIYPFTLLSENMVPDDWVRLGEVIAKEIKKGADAIVVTHGTDTMAYSLSAVSFILSAVPVPIVFTGALHPYGADDGDGERNLWDSILFAAEHEWAGVFLVFQSSERNSRWVYWGPRVQSMKTGGRYFETIDNSQVAKITRGKILEAKNPFKRRRRKSGQEIQINPALDEKVEVFKIYPGFNPLLLLGAIDRGTKAVLIDVYHSGTACVRDGSYRNYSLLPAIQMLRQSKVAVLGAGVVQYHAERYETASKLVEAGLHPLGRMSLEASVVKAMCLLGRGIQPDDLGSEMDKQILFEIAIG